MTNRRAFFVCAMTMVVALLPIIATAQSQLNAALIVRVTDAQGGAPIDNAEVFLLGGDMPQNSLTNAQGLLIFEVQPALYRVQVKAKGYDDSPSTDVDAGEGQRVQITVALQRLHTIASVVARPSVGVSSTDVNENSAERKVSQSLSDALNKIAGVTVDDQILGANSAFNISLHGADSSQTGYSINGMRVGGASAQLTSGLSSLFTGSSIDFSPTADSPAGLINFYTAQPSKIWSYHFTGLVGNYADTLGTFMTTGGFGKFAFAFERAAGGQDSPLNGLFYKDATGNAYEHNGGSANTANMLKASVSLSPVSSLKATVMGGTNRNSYICSNYTAVVPCGNGPGSASKGSNLFETLSFGSLARNVQYNLFANRGSYKSIDDEPNRSVNGMLTPYNGSNSALWSNLGIYASSSARRHTISAGAYTSVNRTAYASSYNGSQTLSGSRFDRYSSIYASDHVKSNDKLALTSTVSRSNGTGIGASQEFYNQVTWQPKTVDAYSVSVGLGSSFPGNTYPAPLGDPASADIDCYNKSVFVSGPSDESTHQTSVSYDIGWKHNFKGGFVSLDAYHNNQFGQTMRLAVPFDGVPSSDFPNGPAAYLTQLQQVWSQPTICGNIPFDASRVFVTELASGLGRLSQGFTVSGQIALGRNVLLYPSYAMTNTYLTTIDSRLTLPGSLYAIGTQLPHHPLHTSGLIVDGVLAKSSLEWLADAQFTSANNGGNLPAYTIYNAGLVLHGQRGSLQVLVGNIFGSHTGLFTTYQAVNAIPVVGGGSFAYATTPLSPRTITLQYDVRWRQHVSSSKKGSAPSPSPSPTPKPHS
ncbi:MAG: carboxypeptidase regulatory-like domain-containing protein [Candidatus Baltobacteraceae bacterium]